MRTLIELFDEHPIHNVLGTETFLPEQTLFLCQSWVGNDMQEKLRKYFEERGCSSRILFLPVNLLDAEAVARIMDWDLSVSLGELDPSKILFVKDEYLHKIADTLKKRKIVNGHAIGRMGQELNVYAGAGVSDDHECVTAEEAIARLRCGMSVLVPNLEACRRKLSDFIKG